METAITVIKMTKAKVTIIGTHSTRLKSLPLPVQKIIIDTYEQYYTNHN